MSDEIQQGHDAAKSMIDNWPWLVAILTPVGELYRRVLKGATKKDLEACSEAARDELKDSEKALWDALNEGRRESDRKITECHLQLRQDIQSVGHQVENLTQHLLRRREDRE